MRELELIRVVLQMTPRLSTSAPTGPSPSFKSKSSRSSRSKRPVALSARARSSPRLDSKSDGGLRDEPVADLHSSAHRYLKDETLAMSKLLLLSCISLGATR